MELPSSCRKLLDDIESGDPPEFQEVLRSCAQNCQSDQCKDVVDFCRATDDPYDQTIKYGLLAGYRTLRDLPLGSIFPKISGKDREKTFSAAPMAILLIGGDHSQSLGSCLCCRNTDCNFYVVLGESERAAAEVCTEQCGDSNVVAWGAGVDNEPIIEKPCQSELNTRFPDLDEDLTRWMEGEVSMDRLEAEYPSVAELCRKIVESELEEFDLLTQICNDCGDGSFRDSSVSFISADGSPISLDDTADSESSNIWIGIGIGIGVVVVIILAIILYRKYRKYKNEQIR